jgi:hypothetical protein
MVDTARNGAGEAGKMGRIGERPYWVLNLSIGIRALHLVGASVVLAVFLLGDMAQPPSFYVTMAFVSGGVLVLTEWLRHRQIYRELAGVSTVTKMLLLGAVYHGVLPARETVLLVFFLASVAAHAPKLVRHKLLF